MRIMARRASVTFRVLVVSWGGHEDDGMLYLRFGTVTGHRPQVTTEYCSVGT